MKICMWWVVGVSIIAVIGIVIKEQVRAKKKSSLSAALCSLKNFRATKHIMDTDGNSGLAIDEGRHAVCLLQSQKQHMQSLNLAQETYEVSTRIISYRDIISCKLFEDGTVVNKTSRMSQAAGVAVGGVLLGGVGAIVGGLSAKTKSEDKVAHIVLRLIINDTASPTHDVNFLGSSGGPSFAKNGLVYKNASESARHWYSLVRVLIERANRETEKGSLVAEELAKLNELRKQGIITDGEFASQKEKLLG